MKLNKGKLHHAYPSSHSTVRFFSSFKLCKNGLDIKQSAMNVFRDKFLLVNGKM